MLKKSPSRVRVALRVLIPVVAIAGSALVVLPTAAHAVSSGATVTYESQVTIPAPPASTFAGAGGGDGWALGMTSAQTFNVFHHQQTLQVNCHNESDASTCWSGPKTIQDGSGHDFAVSGQPGLRVDQATGHLFVFATRAFDSTAGVVCIDTTQPPGVTNPFCGYTPLTASGDGPIDSSSISGVSGPAIVGSQWYAFNYVNSGAPTGGQDEMLCFDMNTLSACTSEPYAVNHGAGSVSDNGGFPVPAIAAIGTDIVVPITTGGGDTIACFDTVAVASCAGAWPIAAPTGFVDNVGSPFPLLGANGSLNGLCLPLTGDPCLNLAGGSVATPTGLASVIAPIGSDSWNGPAAVLGSRIYVPDGNSTNPSTTNSLGSVECFDYSSGSVCPGFAGGLSFNNLTYLYTVNPDPFRPTCLWVNADSGTSQIQNFDAYTGGSCSSGPLRILASSFIASSDVCVPSSWSSLKVVDPSPSSYTSGTIDFQDINGNPIPGVTTHTLDANGSTNLANLNLSTTQGLPQFLITLNGFSGTLSGVTVRFAWSGTFSPSCLSANVTAVQNSFHLVGADGGVFALAPATFDGSLPPPFLGLHVHNIVGIAATGDSGGYWVAGNDGGVFAFGDAAFHGSLPRLGIHTSAVTGVAATADSRGYWLVGNDGGVYCFGDAAFHGSLPGLKIHTHNIVGIATTADGGGYWLIGADGGVYSFGDAVFHGSLPKLGIHTADVVGMAVTAQGGGYWVIGADGGVYSFGDAVFHGSLPGLKIHAGNVVGIASPDSGGYWLTAADGSVFAFGDAPYNGSMFGKRLDAPIVGISR